MAKIQLKVLVCFMGFAVLSIFNINNSFATESISIHVENTIFHNHISLGLS
jgi:hypothetical protein